MIRLLQKHFIKTAWRNLWKYRTTGFINIAGLGIGMAAAFMVLLWVQNEFTFDGFQPDANRDYLVTWMDKSQAVVADGSPFPLTTQAMQRIPGIAGITSYYPHGQAPQIIRIDGRIQTEKNFIFADRNWFRLFHYDFLAGNAQEFGSKNGIILTDRLAKRYFGSAAAVGRTIRMDSIDYTIIAVIKDNPANSSFQFDLFLPLQGYFADPLLAKAQTNWDGFSAKTFVQLRPDMTPAKFAIQLDELMKANGQHDLMAKLISLKEMHFGVGLPSSDIVYGDKRVDVIFACLGVIILLIACINYVNMATAMASVRIKEVTMRKILGAHRVQLFVQFLVEALMTGVLSLLLMILIVWVALPFFDRLSGTHFVLSFGNRSLLTVLFGTWMLSILLTGIYPAILLSGNDPLGMLKAERSPNASTAWARKGLVVIQFTAAISLIIGTIAIRTQLNYIQNRDEGYNRSQIFSIDLPSGEWFKQYGAGKKATLLQAFKTELRRQAGIEDATYTLGSMLDMVMSMAGSADWNGRDPNFNPPIYPLNIDTDFRKIFKVQLASGRWFMPGDPVDKHSYILNETAVRDFGLRQPWIGQRFILMGDTGHVIGIVKDFHFRSFHEKIAPVVLMDDAPWKSDLFVKIAPHGAKAAIRGAGQLFQRFFPDQPFDYTFLDQAFDNLYRSDIRTSQLVGSFSCVAVVLSCLGLLGLATFTARQREKEIATRKILGASVGQIIGLLSGGFLRLVIIAMLIACPIAWWATHKWLEGFAYRTAISWWMFAFAGGVAICIAFLSIATQAINAAIASPVKSLRNQ